MKALVLTVLMMVAIRVAAEGGPLRLTLSDFPLTVTFTNSGKEPLRLLKPLDGSEVGWLMPYYVLTITDACGQPLRYQTRCGNFGLWAESKWPDDYVFVLPAGGSFMYRPQLRNFVITPGEHTLRFKYVYSPPTKEVSSALGFYYPAGVWVGEVTSNEIKKVFPSGK